MPADAGLRRSLARLDGAGETGGSGEPEIDRGRADELLARVAWSRLAEPGDGLAGELLRALGATRMLGLLVSGAGAKRIREIAAAAGASEIGTRQLGAGLERWLPRLDRAASVSDVQRGVAAGMRVLLPGDPGWPSFLERLGEHAPTLLWFRGDAALLSAPSLAVVGARASTGYGAHVTAEITDGVCAAGVTIVSGGAYGIDAVAHRTALAASASTIAVLAGGLDRPYPVAHTSLLGRIADRGLLCSEMVPGSAPTRWRFLQRNRIIAALSSTTLVAEAGVRSGSLNTAGHAAEMGIPLGAIPGPITSASSSGCHRLIREYGAALVTGTEDVLELLRSAGGVPPGELDGGGESSREPALHRRVIDALPLRGARSCSEVARLAGVSPDEARGALAELELLGSVERRETPGAAESKWSLVRRE
ncbi:DNA-protecting protein DprA [Leucobacter sp. CSA1]|uniref:DNA-protecting protein DprA n=1 Tax=Leucobacter chromiisoli TaxID=2796471 RepID=A0A934QB55_9MICO|nr:DNA-protecting protein DprA [Leucobacter chromiisoli]